MCQDCCCWCVEVWDWWLMDFLPLKSPSISNYRGNVTTNDIFLPPVQPQFNVSTLVPFLNSATPAHCDGINIPSSTITGIAKPRTYDRSLCRDLRPNTLSYRNWTKYWCTLNQYNVHYVPAECWHIIIISSQSALDSAVSAGSMM